MADYAQNWIIVLFAIVAITIGWIATVVKGRRPVMLHIRGLGVEIRVSPCPPSCPRAGLVASAKDDHERP